MADDALMLLAKDVRGKTLRILDGITEEQAVFSPPGLQNTILWHAGHALVVVEHLALLPATGQPAQYPQGWFDKFSWKSEPAKVKEWPKLGEVKAELSRQLERLLHAIESATEGQLKAPCGDPARGRHLRWSIIHGLHDEANHQGEMWLLKKLQR